MFLDNKKKTSVLDPTCYFFFFFYIFVFLLRSSITEVALFFIALF